MGLFLSIGSFSGIVAFQSWYSKHDHGYARGIRGNHGGPYAPPKHPYTPNTYPPTYGGPHAPRNPKLAPYASYRAQIGLDTYQFHMLISMEMLPMSIYIDF